MLKKEIIAVYKKLGLTPLQTIELVRKKYPELSEKTIGYAGRLDPMAEGILLLMIGVGNKKGDVYKNLEKTYSVDFFFGAGTDSYDILGLLSSHSKNIPVDLDIKMKSLLEQFRGEILQKPPPYSSIRIRGKKLFRWAQENKLDEIDIPSRNITIYDIALQNITTISTEDLHKKIRAQIKLVTGNFRQEKILEGWSEYFKNSGKKNCKIYTIEISCSSGTYMRSIVNDLGEKTNCPATCLRITRTRVGEYSIKDAIKI